MLTGDILKAPALKHGGGGGDGNGGEDLAAMVPDVDDLLDSIDLLLDKYDLAPPIRPCQCL